MKSVGYRILFAISFPVFERDLNRRIWPALIEFYTITPFAKKVAACRDAILKAAQPKQKLAMTYNVLPYLRPRSFPAFQHIGFLHGNPAGRPIGNHAAHVVFLISLPLLLVRPPSPA